MAYHLQMLRSTATALCLLAILGGSAVAADGNGCIPPSNDGPDAALSRTDHQVSGNRVSDACGPLSAETIVVDLSGTPAWVLPDPSDRGDSWLVALDDGRVERVKASEGSVPRVSRSEVPPLAPGDPPVAAALGQERLVVGSALGAARWFADAIPHARVVEAPSRILLALTGPTGRYDHGVLGDDIEASAITLLDGDDGRTVIELEGDDVIEGTSPLLVDLVGDPGSPEIVITVSDAEAGARLVAYSLDGERVASSEPIGQGYRWLHQIGVAPLGPAGEVEIIAVRTPHIGGVVEAYRLAGDRLERVASESGYSSHQLGSANLDMALLADVDGDGQLDVVVPRQDLASLAALTRVGNGFEEIATLPLASILATNVAATADGTGRLVLAVGTADGRLRIFR